VPDNLTPDQRKRCMSSVRTKDTDIEVRVRSALHRHGLRFRKHVQDLPGRPDIVFPRARVAVFVDGDFWHGRDFDNWRDSVSSFWQKKIDINRARDERNCLELESRGWRVLRLWQHDIENDLDACVEHVRVLVA